jgi:two-component system nitrate/nitrite response regulator NarL
MNASALIIESQFTLDRETIAAISDRFDLVGHIRWMPNRSPLDQSMNPKILIACIAGQASFRNDLRVIGELFPKAKIVVIATTYDRSEMNDALTAGAVAYLMNDLSTAALLGALTLAATEDLVLLAGHPLAAALYAPIPSDRANAPGVAPSLADLSPRETTILDLVKGGDSNKHIARKLGIAEATVKCHVKAILRKINVRNRFDAAMWALRVDEMERQSKIVRSDAVTRPCLDPRFDLRACERSAQTVGAHVVGQNF